MKDTAVLCRLHPSQAVRYWLLPSTQAVSGDSQILWAKVRISWLVSFRSTASELPYTTILHQTPRSSGTTCTCTEKASWKRAEWVLYTSRKPGRFFYSINVGNENPKTNPAIAMKLRLRAVKITAAAFVAAVPAVSAPEWIPST